VAEVTILNGQATWVEGMQFVMHGAKSGATFVVGSAHPDSKPEGAVSPMEALLLSLAGCTGMDVVSILQKKQQHVTGLHINLRGMQAEEYPKRFTRIELEFVLRGPDITAPAVERAIALSMDKYCSVRATLNSEVVPTYRIETP
jgi:putative redox protein